jgi:hypothetical protein
MYLYFHLEFKICCIHIFSKRKLAYTRSGEADVTSLLNSICNFDFVITIVTVYKLTRQKMFGLVHMQEMINKAFISPKFMQKTNK